VFADIALTAEHRSAWITTDGVALGGGMVEQEQGWIAGSGDDLLEGGAGRDLLVGGDGIDTAVYTGPAAGYGLSLSASGDIMIAAADGDVDTLRQIERAEFDGVALELGFTEAGGAVLQQLGMLYHLTLGRAGDFPGFLYWLQSGLEGTALAQGFTGSAEFERRFSGLDDAGFVRLLYQHTTANDPDAATLAQWDTYLDTHSRADLVTLLSTDVTLVGSLQGVDGLSLVGSLSGV